MKKLALVLAVLMLAVACVVPVAAADAETKTISFGVRSEEEAAYLDESDSSEEINVEGFDQRIAKEDTPAIYKFNIGKGVTSASVVIPVCYKFEVFASVDGENWTSVYDWKKYEEACNASDTDMMFYKEWGPLTDKEAIDLSSVVKADVETLYIKLQNLDGDNATIYCTEEARSVALRYYNAQLNRLNQKKPDGSDWGNTDEHDEFTFDGKFTLTYTVASQSGETEPVAPPQTADFTAAVVAAAVVALGAAIVVAKKKH